MGFVRDQVRPSGAVVLYGYILRLAGVQVAGEVQRVLPNKSSIYQKKVAGNEIKIRKTNKRNRNGCGWLYSGGRGRLCISRCYAYSTRHGYPLCARVLAIVARIESRNKEASAFAGSHWDDGLIRIGL